MRNAKFLQVVDTCGVALGTFCGRLGKGEELALVNDSRRRMHAEIAMVHFVNHRVGDVGGMRTFVCAPSLGVSLGEIDNSGTVAVGTGGLGPDTGRFI